MCISGLWHLQPNGEQARLDKSPNQHTFNPYTPQFAMVEGALLALRRSTYFELFTTPFASPRTALLARAVSTGTVRKFNHIPPCAQLRLGEYKRIEMCFRQGQALKLLFGLFPCFDFCACADGSMEQVRRPFARFELNQCMYYRLTAGQRWWFRMGGPLTLRYVC
jgi:hypothetical protein